MVRTFGDRGRQTGLADQRRRGRGGRGCRGRRDGGAASARPIRSPGNCCGRRREPRETSGVSDAAPRSSPAPPAGSAGGSASGSRTRGTSSLLVDLDPAVEEVAAAQGARAVVADLTKPEGVEAVAEAAGEDVARPRQQRRHHPRRPRHEDDRGRVRRGDRDQPHRGDPPDAGARAALPPTAPPSSTSARAPRSATSARPTTAPRRRGWSASAGRWLSAGRRGSGSMPSPRAWSTRR